MPRIKRDIYHEAVEKILEKAGHKYHRIGLGKILVYKNTRKIYVEIAGKNLPYFGKHGEEAFLWETHIQPNRLDKIEVEAQKHGAESWIAFCYAILKEEYKQYFSTIVTLNGIDLGTKFIKTNIYRNHMKPRSPSWAVVDLPREKVIQITCDVENI